MKKKLPSWLSRKWVDMLQGSPVQIAASPTANLSSPHVDAEKARDLAALWYDAFSLCPDGIVTLNGQGNVSYSNDAFTRMTGCAGPDVLGLTEAAFLAKLKLRCAIDQHVERLVDLEQSAKVGASIEKLALIEILATPARFVELRLRRSISGSKILYLRDVTKEARVRESKNEYLAKAAHELRAPMAVIMGYAEVMLSKKPDRQQMQEYASIIQTSSARMAQTLSDIEDLANLELRAGLKVHTEELDLMLMLKKAMLNVPTPTGRPPTVINFTDSSIHIQAVAEEVQKVLQNLLSNAYKFSAADSYVEVSFHAQTLGANGPLAGVRIRDHGIGMTPSSLTRICEKFYKAEKSREILGAGLGMSIVQEIMIQSGGQLLVESEIDIGTEVTVLFPLSEQFPGA